MLSPSNTSLLSPLRYTFQIQRLPTVTYWGTSINLPGLILPVGGEIDNPFVPIKVPGTVLKFEPLTLNFQVDEDLSAWQEIYNWLVGLGFPETFEQYSDMVEENEIKDTPYSDATLRILTNNSNSNLIVKFKDIFPTGLGQLKFSTSETNVLTISCSATFEYLLYNIQQE